MNKSVAHAPPASGALLAGGHADGTRRDGQRMVPRPTSLPACDRGARRRDASVTCHALPGASQPSAGSRACRHAQRARRQDDEPKAAAPSATMAHHHIHRAHNRRDKLYVHILSPAGADTDHGGQLSCINDSCLGSRDARCPQICSSMDTRRLRRS